MVEGPKHTSPTTASVHAPEIQKGHGMIVGSEKVSSPALLQSITNLNEQINEWNADPKDSSQIQIPFGRQARLVVNKGQTATAEIKQADKSARLQIQRFSEDVKGNSPSLQRRTREQPAPQIKKRKGKH